MFVVHIMKTRLSETWRVLLGAIVAAIGELYAIQPLGLVAEAAACAAVRATGLDGGDHSAWLLGPPLLF